MEKAIVVELLTDIAHGMTWELDGMGSLIQIIKSEEIDAIIVKDYDRITRNIYALDKFYNFYQKRSVELISVLLGNSFCDTPLFVKMRELVSKAFLSTKI